MAEPTADVLQRALHLSSVPRRNRSAAEEGFLGQFWTDFLQPLPDEDPSRLAARLFGHLGTIRVRLVNQGYESHYSFVPPPPELSVSVSEPNPPARRHRRSRRAATVQEAANSPARTDTRLTAVGNVLGTLLDVGHRLKDDQIGAFLADREHPSIWQNRIGRLAIVATALVFTIIGFVGLRAAWIAWSAAHRHGGDVQQRQQQVGDFSERLSTEP